MIHKKFTSRVYLVGVGPGDTELITCKAMRLIKNADCLIYDRLINKELLSYSLPDAKKIYVGKKPGEHSKTQDEINNILVECAKKYNFVVRLKGGDPFVFGRGGEEALTLKQNNFIFEIVPGVTSAIAVPEYAGIPVTHRGVSRSFAVITGHTMNQPQTEDYSWKKAVKHIDTLVFLMGVKNLPMIVNTLLIEGLKKDTPIAIIQQGTLLSQEKRIGTLESILEIVHNQPIFSPCIIIVGNTVLLEKNLKWFETKPLFGKTIIVTRARQQASSLKLRLESLGANVICLPTIKISVVENNQNLRKAIQKINLYKWIIFTSVNAVDIFFRELFTLQKDCRSLNNARIAAIGKATADRLLKFGIVPDVLPKRFIAEELAEEIEPFLENGDAVLLPRAIGSRKFLPDYLEKKNCLVKEIGLYEAVIDTQSAKTLKKLIETKQKIDCITFTSSSTVHNFFELCKNECHSFYHTASLYSIGPITSNTLRKYTDKKITEASEYSIDGIVEKIIENEMVSIS